MRRLIAYITVAASLVVGMALSFLNVAQKISSNLEFADGKQFVYRLTDKENADAVIPEEAVKEMASTMQERLETALVTKYDIVTEGSNQIRVTISEATQNRYERIRKYLNFDGEFSLCTTRNTCVVGDEMFLDSAARVDYRGQFPYVVIPLSNPDYFVEHIEKEAKDIYNTSSGGDSTAEVGKEAYIQLWANRTEEDSYELSLTDTKMAEKVIMEFNPFEMYWEEGETGEIASAINLYNYGSPDSNNYFSPSIVKEANEVAYYYRNLFNASSLDYNVEYLFTQNVPASIESIINLGASLTPNWSRTLIASIIVGVILIIVLAYFYRLTSVSVIVNLAVTLFTSFFAFVLLGMQFSSATLIGLMILGGLSLFSSLYHVHNLKNELYYGRSMKKANIEANRKSTGLTINISVITLLIGLFSYLFGGNLVRNLAVLVMIGSVGNLLFVFTLFRGLTWLLANEPRLAKQYKVFGIDEKKVPNTFNEEKQTYFGRFADVDYSRKSLSIGIGALIFAILGGALFTYLSLSGQPIIAPTENQVQTRLYFEVTKQSDIESAKYVEDNILEYLMIEGEKFQYSGVNTFELERIEDEVSVDYRFYVIDSEHSYKLTSDTTYEHNGSYSGTLEDVLYQVVYAIDNDEEISSVSIHQIEQKIEQPKIGQMALATLISLLVAALYMSFPYKVSRSAAAFATSSLSAISIITFLAITRIQSSPIAGLVMFLVTAYSLFLSSYMFSKEKELIDEDKSKEEKLTLRKKMAIKAVGISSSSLLLLTGISSYIALNYFGFGPGVMAPLFAVSALGILLSTLLTFTLNPTISLYIAKVFAKWNINIQLPKRRSRRNKPEAPRSAEPQESIIIGIND